MQNFSSESKLLGELLNSSNLKPQMPQSGVYMPQPHDRNNPNTWDILYLDQSIPVDLVSKAYMIRDLQNWTRRYLLIPIKIIANILLALIMTVKRLLPFQFSAYEIMHKSAAYFLDNFASPEACYLIVRHLCIGSNIVNFLIDNGPDLTIEKSQLYPRTVEDLANNAFLNHDLILYNFVWDYNEAIQRNPNWIQEVKQREINYESVKPVEVNIDWERRRWLNLDLESAIELFKVFYSLCLTSDEFERAVVSLQLDENFGLYISRVVGSQEWNHIIINRHPLAPNSPFGAARDLFLHGIVSEYLHRYLELAKLSSED